MLLKLSNESAGACFVVPWFRRAFVSLFVFEKLLLLLFTTQKLIGSVEL
jgi:hypothetical protein